MTKVSFGEKVHSPQKLTVMVDRLVEQGISSEEALCGLDISRQELHSPGVSISTNQLIAGCRNAVRLSRDQQFPYQVGSNIHLPMYGMYGFALLSSTDFRETMAFTVKYHALATPLCTISFAEVDGFGVWTIAPLHHPQVDEQIARFLVELEIGSHTSLHRDLDSAFAPTEVRLTYEPSDDFALTEELVGCAVRFRQPANQIVFPSAWLDKRPRLGNRATYLALEEICRELHDGIVQRVGIVGKVRQVLLQDIANPPTFATTAKLLNTNARTLHRQLRSQGTSYRELIDELKAHIAIKYLRETPMTNEDVAFALGFSDAANFRHAFRRWTDRTPTAFRPCSKGSTASRFSLSCGAGLAHPRPLGDRGMMPNNHKTKATKVLEVGPESGSLLEV